MKHAIIFAHPSPTSFTRTAVDTYRSAAEARGHTVLVRDLYAVGFDPCLKVDEIPYLPNFEPHDDVKKERLLLAGTDVFAFFYPLWLNAPPAILKGYLERVFGMGFAYERRLGSSEPLLSGRKMISFTSSGAPTDWVVKTGAWDAMRKLFDEHFSLMCGLTILDHVHFGQIVPGMRADVIARECDRIRAQVEKHF